MIQISFIDADNNPQTILIDAPDAKTSVSAIYDQLKLHRIRPDQMDSVAKQLMTAEIPPGGESEFDRIANNKELCAWSLRTIIDATPDGREEIVMLAMGLFVIKNLTSLVYDMSPRCRGQLLKILQDTVGPEEIIKYTISKRMPKA
jgi:hypothetical protein